MEMLLLGLGGCSAFDVMLILKRGREAVTDCVVDIEAERATDGSESLHQDPDELHRDWPRARPSRKSSARCSSRLRNIARPAPSWRRRPSCTHTITSSSLNPLPLEQRHETHCIRRLERRPERWQGFDFHRKRRAQRHPIFLLDPLRGRQEGTNPEELIAAAHAGCFSMALSAQLANENKTAEKIETEAAVTLFKTDAGFTITAVHLKVRAKVPGTTPPDFQKCRRSRQGRLPDLSPAQGGDNDGSEARRLDLS